MVITDDDGSISVSAGEHNDTANDNDDDVNGSDYDVINKNIIQGPWHTREGKCKYRKTSPRIFAA